MAIKELLEQNTDVVELATSLLAELSDRDGQYVWKQLTAEGGDFVAFVTADNEDSYPNGGTQDGYWYELVEEGITGIDIGEITPSGDVTSLTVPTKLTTLPSAFLIYTKSRSAGEYEIGVLFTTNHDVSASYGYYGVRVANTAGPAEKISSLISYSNGKLTISGGTFSGGVVYKWLAIA